VPGDLLKLLRVEIDGALAATSTKSAADKGFVRAKELVKV
jgi:hypothetical protein